MTREEIEQLYVEEPNCFETGREEQWYKVGLKEGLAAADSHPHWIPVEERLPETIDWYLCYNDLEDGCEVLHWEGDGNVWMDNDWHYKSKEVTHWMEIHQPRKEE